MDWADALGIQPIDFTELVKRSNEELEQFTRKLKTLRETPSFVKLRAAQEKGRRRRRPRRRLTREQLNRWMRATDPPTTNQDLHEGIGVNARTIQRWRTGERAIPADDELIARIYTYYKTRLSPLERAQLDLFDHLRELTASRH